VGGVLFEVSDNISAVLAVGDTSECHSVSGGVVSWGFQVLVERGVSPGLVTESLEGTGVGESFLLCGIGAECVLEHGTSAVSTHAVADSAERLEDFFAFSGVTIDLLFLRSHLFVRLKKL